MQQYFYGINLSGKNEVLETKIIEENEKSFYDIVFVSKEVPDSYGNGVFDVMMIKVPDTFLGELRIKSITGNWSWKPRNAKAIIYDPYGNSKIIEVRMYQKSFDLVFQNLFSQIISECINVNCFGVTNWIESAKKLLNKTEPTTIDEKNLLIKEYKKIILAYRDLTMHSKIWNNVDPDDKTIISSLVERITEKI